MQVTLTGMFRGTKGGRDLQVEYDPIKQEFTFPAPDDPSMDPAFGHAEAQGLIRFLEQCMAWQA
jgi:hypothetical protein